MTLPERINEDFKIAFKAREEAKVSTLRMLKAALKNKQIDLMRELTEEEVLAVVKSQIKQLKDSIDAFTAGGRSELSASAATEVCALEAYLPAQMDDATLSVLIKEALNNANITAKADQGKAMGVAMKAVAGKADGTRVRAIVETLLAVFAFLTFFVPVFAVHAAGVGSMPTQFVFTDTSIRIARIFLLLMGVLAVNIILVGSFTMITSGGRDELFEKGMKQMSAGVFASIVIMALFFVATDAVLKGL